MPGMDMVDREIQRFNEIVRQCGKEDLHLRLKVLDCEAIGLHLVVSSPSSGAAYQVGRSWPAAFAHDLAHGVFG